MQESTRAQSELASERERFEKEKNGWKKEREEYFLMKEESKILTSHQKNHAQELAASFTERERLMALFTR